MRPIALLTTAMTAVLVAGAVTPAIADEDRSVIEAALELLPAAVDATTWSAWTGAVKERTGAKGRGLFMPLRRALTGLEHGPDMGAILPLIPATHHWWESNRNRLLVSLAFAAMTCGRNGSPWR